MTHTEYYEELLGLPNLKINSIESFSRKIIIHCETDLAKWVFKMCAKQPFTEVGALVNISHKTVGRLYYEEAEARIDLPGRYARVRKIGTDEIANRKGKQDYVCVLTDLERGTQPDVLPDRKKETLLTHFQSLGQDFANRLRSSPVTSGAPTSILPGNVFPKLRSS